MDIYFMRHGETDWNTVKRLQGRTDIPLNENGIEKAREVSLAVHKNGIFFDEIFTSPLVRAQKTAQIMNAFSDSPIKIDGRLTEFCFGEAEGVTLDEIKNGTKFENIKNWFLNPSEYRAQAGSESFEDFFSRIDDFLNDLKKIADKKSILAVCLGGVVRGLFLRMKNLPISDFSALKIPNCGLNLARLENGVFKIQYVARTF